MSLTDVAVRNAKPLDGKPLKLFDGKGLYLYVSASGRKTWRLKYRFQGREKLLTLGKYPQMSLAEARKVRTASRKQLAVDMDPAERKKTAATAQGSSTKNGPPAGQVEAKTSRTEGNPESVPAASSCKIIDLATWKRRPYYEHYMNTVRCTYSVTLNIDVDKLVQKIRSLGLKTYPVQIYMLSRVVNQLPEFRMAINTQGRLVCWELTHPSYAIFNQNTETFSSIYSPFTADFAAFYERCVLDLAAFSTAETLFPQPDQPENIFTISSLPWASFTGFNLNVHGEGTYLPPIFTIGRYLELNGKMQMPLAIQAHHAVCDGYHVGQFAEALQDLASYSNAWL